ncbi:MAG: hypothetical protein GXW85_05055 [Clostridia bacterium]|nr:hypothetical protein [Clostridia bacterium]
MNGKKELKLFEPYEVGDLVVFLTGEDSANVIDADCRWELQTTTTGCNCCTYRFRSRLDKDFKCRHMKALLEVLKAY